MQQCLIYVSNYGASHIYGADIQFVNLGYVQPLRHYPRMQQCLLYVTNSGASIVYGADIQFVNLGYHENTDVVP